MKKIFLVAAVALIPLATMAQVTFNKDLRYGMTSSNEVARLQEFLTGQGFYSGPMSGNYFSLTRKAVKNFQIFNGISPASGNFLKITRWKANEILANQLTESAFEDDFSGDFPGNTWVVVKNPGYNQSSPYIDATVGNPAPSLAMPFAGVSSTNIGIDGIKIALDTHPFNSSDGFSISADIRQPDTSPEGAYTGTWMRSFRFEIKNITNQYAYARADISPDRETIDYSIYRAYSSPLGASDVGSYVTTPYTPDTKFHNFKFVVDKFGSARWYRDGILKSSFGKFPTGDYLISMTPSGRNLPPLSTSTARYSHNVDNVIVSIP